MSIKHGTFRTVLKESKTKKQQNLHKEFLTMRINDLVHKTKTQRPQLQSEQQLTEQTHGEQATTMSQN